jgi:hypothetical protein
MTGLMKYPTSPFKLKEFGVEETDKQTDKRFSSSDPIGEFY